MRIPLWLITSQIVCMTHCLLHPDELPFTLVVKRVTVDIKTINQSQDSQRTANTVEEKEHMSDGRHSVSGEGKRKGKESHCSPAKSTDLLEKIPSNTNDYHAGMSGLELVDSSRAVTLAKPVMLPCQGQTMGNLLVTWYMAIFKPFSGQCCLPECWSVASGLNRVFRDYWSWKTEKEADVQWSVLVQTESAEMPLKLGPLYQEDALITSSLSKPSFSQMIAKKNNDIDSYILLYMMMYYLYTGALNPDFTNTPNKPSSFFFFFFFTKFRCNGHQ